MIKSPPTPTTPTHPTPSNTKVSLRSALQTQLIFSSDHKTAKIFVKGLDFS